MTHRTTLLVAAAALLAAAACERRADADSPRDPDAREAVILPAAARPELRDGMLAMLGSLHGTARALAAGDTAAAARAAAESGMGHAGMMPVTLRRTAPAAFLSLGMRTHQAFDALARRASDGASPDSIRAAMAEVLGACTACHERFRADWRHGGEERRD
jgi:hypothetical protein